MILDEVEDNQCCIAIVWSTVDITRLEEITELEAVLIVCSNNMETQETLSDTSLEKGNSVIYSPTCCFKPELLFLLLNTNSRYFELYRYSELYMFGM